VEESLQNGHRQALGEFCDQLKAGPDNVFVLLHTARPDVVDNVQGKRLFILGKDV